MPRGVNISRILPKLGPKQKVVPRTPAGGPKLFNAKRKIKTSRGVTDRFARETIEKDAFNEEWRKHVSEDVSQFVDDMEAQGTKLLPEERLALLQNPARYFSRPQNVPTSLRQQVYFPDFSIQLRRTERLGPYYAQFHVPLWFSKLDLKSYLKELYNVDVLHIRSYVVYRKIIRKQAKNPYTKGELFQPKQRKRMTVQLVEPFMWPQKDSEVDRSAFGNEIMDELVEKRTQESEIENDQFGMALDHEQRKSIAEQAQELLQGKAKWSPTWQQLPHERRVMEGIVPDHPLPSMPRLLPPSISVRSAKSFDKRWGKAFPKKKYAVEQQ